MIGGKDEELPLRYFVEGEVGVGPSHRQECLQNQGRSIGRPWRNSGSAGEGNGGSTNEEKVEGCSDKEDDQADEAEAGHGPTKELQRK